MTSKNEITVSKWPFFLADGIFVAAAGLSLWFASEPVGAGPVVAAVLLLLLGATVSLVPYLVETFWKWQQSTADQQEKMDLQRQVLAKTGGEIAEVVRRWEAMEEKSPGSEAAGDLNRQIEATARGFEQWQARLEKQEGDLVQKLGTLLQQDSERRREDREHLEGILAQFAALSQKEEGAGVGTGNGGAVAVEALVDDAQSLEESPVEVQVEVPAKAKVEPEPEASDEGEKAPVVRREKKPGKQPKVREETGASLFSTTTLVATAFIGASNKLFLRGDGPGLNWEEGVPMQFVEIGKWSWTTTDAAKPIRVRVFKNDEEEDKAGVLTVEPGQRLDIRPDFDG